jgi:VIT1/CCC1 family predicted Fe2+/Mn2+ transporter
MSSRTRSREVLSLRPLALGLSDGILNALVLASAAVLRTKGGITVGLALRVSAVAFVTGMVMFLVAEYAQLRSELVRAERQLNMTHSGQLAAGHLGHRVRVEATWAAAIASASSLVGALVPLLIGAMLPSLRWISIAVAVGALGGLGAVLAHTVGGNSVRWAVVMTLSGAVVAAIGVQLHLTG